MLQASTRLSFRLVKKHLNGGHSQCRLPTFVREIDCYEVYHYWAASP